MAWLRAMARRSQGAPGVHAARSSGGAQNPADRVNEQRGRKAAAADTCRRGIERPDG